MKYVLDAPVALSWVIPRPLTPKAMRLRDEYRQAVHDLIAPSIFPAEVASALTKSERQKIVPVGQGRILFADVLTTAPVLHSYGPLLYRATDISSQTRSGLNDCLYVALAEQEGCEFVTADQKCSTNLRPHFGFIRDLATLP